MLAWLQARGDPEHRLERPAIVDRRGAEQDWLGEHAHLDGAVGLEPPSAWRCCPERLGVVIAVLAHVTPAFVAYAIILK